jgi:hypothetical protein
MHRLISQLKCVYIIQDCVHTLLNIYIYIIVYGHMDKYCRYDHIGLLWMGGWISWTDLIDSFIDLLSDSFIHFYKRAVCNFSCLIYYIERCPGQ